MSSDNNLRCRLCGCESTPNNPVCPKMGDCAKCNDYEMEREERRLEAKYNPPQPIAAEPIAKLGVRTQEERTRALVNEVNRLRTNAGDRHSSPEERDKELVRIFSKKFFNNTDFKEAARHKKLSHEDFLQFLLAGGDDAVTQQVLSMLRDYTEPSTEAVEHPAPLQPEVIEGVCRVGYIASLTAPSKVGKTYTLLRIAHAIATGGEWMGFQCREHPVLFINCELFRPEIHRRIKHITGGEASSNMQILNLRGTNIAAHELLAALEEGYKQHVFTAKVVIFDPIYRLYPTDFDENSNSNMLQVMQALERFAHKIEATVIYAHHHAKGGRDAMAGGDRGAGASALRRFYDANIDLTQVKFESTDHSSAFYKLSLDLRNFPYQEDRLVRLDRDARQFVNATQEEFEEAKDEWNTDRSQARAEKQEQKKAEKKRQADAERKDHCDKCLSDWKTFWNARLDEREPDLLFTGWSGELLTNTLISFKNKITHLKRNKNYRQAIDTSKPDWAKKLVKAIKTSPEFYGLTKTDGDEKKPLLSPMKESGSERLAEGESSESQSE